MKMFELNKFIENDFNLMEIFMVSKRHDTRIDINIKQKSIDNIKKKYSNWKQTDQVIFYKNRMMYQYDLGNDNQLLFTKEMIDRQSFDNIEVLSYKYCKIPTYMFPCVNEIDERVEYDVEECRITNRISIILKKNIYASSVYIEYKHSSQAEIEKNEKILKDIIDTITNESVS